MLWARRVADCCLAADAIHAVMKPQSVCMCDGQCLLVNRSGTCAARDVGRLTATAVQLQNISELTSLTSLPSYCL